MNWVQIGWHIRRSFGEQWGRFSAERRDAFRGISMRRLFPKD